MPPHAEVNCVDPVWWPTLSCPHPKDDSTCCHQQHGVLQVPTHFLHLLSLFLHPTLPYKLWRLLLQHFINGHIFLLYLQHHALMTHFSMGYHWSLPSHWKLFSNPQSPTVLMRTWSLHHLKSMISFSTWLKFYRSTKSTSMMGKTHLFHSCMGTNSGIESVQKLSRLLSSPISYLVYSWVMSESPWWFETSPLNHKSPCLNNALIWDKVCKTLGDTIHQVKNKNQSCIKPFVSHMIKNHTNVEILWPLEIRMRSMATH